MTLEEARAELEALMERAHLSGRERHGMEDWAIARVAELRAAGEAAKFRVVWKVREGRREYRVEVRRANDVVERPVWPMPLGGAESVES